MPDTHTQGEMHGCIVCGRLYQLYVVYDKDGRFVDCKVMSPGGRRVPDAQRPLVACDTHSAEDVKRAVERVYGKSEEEDE
jgi:hypothetical protein